MNDTKRCPACNQQVPALAVRCKFCGIRLDVAAQEIPMIPPTEPPGDEDDDLDLGSDDDLSNASIPIAALSARLSAPPPTRGAISTAPPARGPVSVPPSAPIAPMAAPRVSSVAPPPIAPRGVSAGPPPIAPPPSVAPSPPIVMPAVVATMPPPARVVSQVAASHGPVMTSSAAVYPSASVAHSTPPPSTKRTMMGMAPVTFPSSGSSLPRPSNSPSSAIPVNEVYMDDLEPTPMPGIPNIPAGDLFSQPGFDSLDLDGDIIDDDVDEISKFTEQTAITDVSTLAAQGMSQSRVEDVADVSADILDEIMEQTPSTARPLPSAPPKPQPYIPHSSVPPTAAVSSPYPPTSHAPAAFPSASPPSAAGVSRAPAPMSRTHGASPSAVLQGAMPGSAGFKPLGPMLEADTGIHHFSSSQKSPMKVVYVLLGLLVLVGGGVIAYQFLNGEGETVATPDGSGTQGVADNSSAKGDASKNGTPAEQKSADSTGGEAKSKGHTCKSLSEYPGFAWRDKLEALAKASNKSSICGLFGVSKEDIVTAMRGTPSFGPTGYDLLPRSTVFEIFPLGKAERRAPSMELIFIDDLLFEIRMNYATSGAASLDPEMFKPALGAPKVVADDPLSREIKIYTDEDMIIFWYKKIDPYKRVFNEVVFSSRTIRTGLEKELKDRSDAQIAFEQGMVLFNQKQPMRAVNKFRDARKIIPNMGAAYIFEGLALLQNEQFDKLEAVAVQAFEAGTDDRARAGAKGLQAVAALYHGDKEGALSLFNNAAGLDPADPEFSTAAAELKTGDYDPSRVAKTAARMECRKNHSEWSVKGLLARGNFPNDDAFEKAEKSARKKPGYKASFDMWNAWECN